MPLPGMKRWRSHDVTFEQARSQIGKGGDKLIPVFLSADEQRDHGKEMEEWRGERFKTAYLPLVCPFSAVPDLLRRVRNAGVRVAIASSAKKDALDALRMNCSVGGGTSYFWARPDARLSVDVLFIDEAAQMALANVLAVAQAAQSVVLLGDPRQLEQPIQGSHPDGVGVSALDHVLGLHATIPADRGLFLAETWRLHPLICAFNSELFYEGRLKSRPGLERQKIRIKSGLNGSGLRYLPVQHDGNQSSSPEEADAIRDLIADIVGSGTIWVDRKGIESPISLDDVLIIAPYNAQVFELQERLPGARIGTVDKFQGQEAPIVIYSMATSSHADAPRGMEFLYSANRLNVAVSRAKCVCIVVASPRLFEAECRTPRQMQLANAFCRYAELASVL
jgi:superfamily I DNA and/or RNA helicase